MSVQEIKVLLVEDNPLDIRLVWELMRSVREIKFEIETAGTLAAAIDRLSGGGIDIVLLDLMLPDSTGMDTFVRMQLFAPDLPLIVLSGLEDGSTADMAVREGAQDYLVKGMFDQNLLIRSVRYAIERKRAEEKLRQSMDRFMNVFMASPALMSIVSLKNRSYIDVNSAFIKETGYNRGELIGCSVDEYEIWIRDNYIEKMVDGYKPFENREIRYKKKNGELRVGLLSTVIIELDAEKCLLSIIIDITERKQAEEILRSLSYLDGLTAVANRRHFDEVFEKEWRRAMRDKKPLSLIMADIDHFKIYNDTYGHLAGDECLKKVALTVKSTLHRPGDLLARFGGEEFIALLPETPVEGAVMIAETMRRRVEEMEILHGELKVSTLVTISLGVATVVPVAGMPAETLITGVDKALYHAKQTGRNRVCMAGDLISLAE